MNLQISEEGIRSSVYVLLTAMELSFQPTFYLFLLLAPKLPALNSKLFIPVHGDFDIVQRIVIVTLESVCYWHLPVMG